MGTQSTWDSLLVTSKRNTKMKIIGIALLAAVAIAEPEAKPKADADPYLLYGGYRGYGLGHLGYSGYHGLGYSYYGKREAEAKPKAAAEPYLYGGYYGHGLGYSYYGKREAEPKADADAYLYGGYYGHGLGYAGHYGYPYGGYSYYG